MEALGRALISFHELSDGKGNKDKRYGSHQETEGNIPNCFEAGFSGRETVRINAFDGTVGDNKSDVGHRVEDSICHSGEQGKRA